MYRAVHQERFIKSKESCIRWTNTLNSNNSIKPTKLIHSWCIFYSNSTSDNSYKLLYRKQKFNNLQSTEHNTVIQTNSNFFYNTMKCCWLNAVHFLQGFQNKSQLWRSCRRICSYKKILSECFSFKQSRSGTGHISYYSTLLHYFTLF